LIVGGVSSIGGTLIGAAFIEFVPNLADKVSKAAPGAVYGVILIAVMFLMPAGAGGFIHSMWRKLFRTRPEQGADRAQPVEAGAVTYEPTVELNVMKPSPELVDRPAARND
jgi:branched-chain amino acid transport system permease protein